MTVHFPEATPVLGNIKVNAMLAVANLAAIKLATEWNAASSVDLSCFLRPFATNVTSASGTAPNRLCTTITLPNEGRTEIGAFELRYVYNPQEDDTDPDNKAKGLLVRGAVLTLGIRKGLDARLVPAAVGDHTEAWAVRLGRQNRVTSGDDDQADTEDEVQHQRSCFFHAGSSRLLLHLVTLPKQKSRHWFPRMVVPSIHHEKERVYAAVYAVGLLKLCKMLARCSLLTR